jgi:hypothetical protein
MTFRTSGRDLSGQRAHKVTSADYSEAAAQGWAIECESCRARAALAKAEA